jgi:two-component system sensor histidine kinase GlrK
MSLRLRFLLSLFAVILVMAVPAFFAVNRVNALRDIALELQTQAAQSSLSVGRLDAGLLQLGQFQLSYVVHGDTASAALMRKTAEELVARSSTLRAAGHSDLVQKSELRLDELAVLNRRLVTLVQQGKLDEAANYLNNTINPEIERSREAVSKLAIWIDEKTSGSVPIARETALAAGTATTAAVFAAIVLACALALAAAGVLTHPLDRLRVAMARVADGALDAPFDLPYDRDDELGDLSRSFRTMTLRLTELDRLKAEFVGTASHDLKTPISIISGYAELIHDELDGTIHARHRELLRSLSEQTVTLQRRVDQLLEISRMEAGRLRLGLEEINVRYFAEEVRRAFEPAARVRDLKFDVNVHDTAPPFLIADPDVLRTDIIGNLVGNALKFTPAGGIVRMSIRPDGDRLSIEVADTGCGIAPEQLDHVFEKYYQGRRTNGGGGLGLAIAKAGVEAHGGRIQVTSRVERGTRFRVSLPVRAVTPSTPNAGHLVG